MEFVYNHIWGIIIHLLDAFSVFKMAINFYTTLENVEKQELKARTYYNPSMTYSDVNLIFSRLQNATGYLNAGLQHNFNQEGR
jgi:hypothetical protein